MMHYAQWNLSHVINDTKGFFHISNYHGKPMTFLTCFHYVVSLLHVRVFVWRMTDVTPPEVNE